jgi:hypothetical protein
VGRSIARLARMIKLQIRRRPLRRRVHSMNMFL